MFYFRLHKLNFVNLMNNTEGVSNFKESLNGVDLLVVLFIQRSAIFLFANIFTIWD